MQGLAPIDEVAMPSEDALAADEPHRDVFLALRWIRPPNDAGLACGDRTYAGFLECGGGVTSSFRHPIDACSSNIYRSAQKSRSATTALL